MEKQGVTQRRKPASAEGESAEASSSSSAAAAAPKQPNRDEIIYKNGKAYKRRKPRHDVWTMLSQGAPPEPGSETAATSATNKPRRPPRWYDNVVWPAMLFLTFLLSLFIFHVAPHETSKARKVNRFTMDNIATGGFADGGERQPQRVWGMPAPRSENEEKDGEKKDDGND
eukprot:CAMPEP_0113573956 /NCGR_PEP_ID=MMETSP0015_2-20120614/26893_1 /TAXON_ID=2838 /ORGANISM="Odontella" /LENGTH=170 /DNA_ID=CAMNT_0000477067 /DNA_START=156 /DNA_END=668 /DNA_ORIENTATION=- /assembly_acc=CAM_ASM_000160